jgi:UDP-N-acetylglucosamine--N-acetylmuramyl-(pentapeptide) pyrophosphoryl-undecaprenol N-acetylglucosamine transferase
VTGRRDYEQFAGAPTPRGEGLWHEMVPYEERMALLYAAADVMVCRAGAMTVAELTEVGVPSVLVPLPGAPRDHQRANAMALVRSGAAILVPDEDCDAERLDATLGALLADAGALGSMETAARKLGRPDAAERVADVVERHARS